MTSKRKTGGSGSRPASAGPAGASPAAEVSAETVAGFDAGDVVQRVSAGVHAAAGGVVAAGTVGTVCRVVNPGRSYMVRWADVPICVLVFQDSMRPAPAGTPGPACEADC